jgi:hypothetical protein
MAKVELLGTSVNKGYLRGPGPLREERPRSCLLTTTAKDTGPGFLYGSSSVSSPVRSHVAALPTTLSGSTSASIIVTAVLTAPPLPADLSVSSAFPISTAHNVSHKTVLYPYRHALSYILTTGGVYKSLEKRGLLWCCSEIWSWEP